MDNSIKPMTFDLKDLEGKAKNGDKLACYILGRSYDSEENGAEQSYEKAMYWYEKGKELGDPCCTYGVGACYYFGDGVPPQISGGGYQRRTANGNRIPPAFFCGRSRRRTWRAPAAG